MTHPRTGATFPEGQPFYFHPADNALSYFAGLWDTWTAPNGAEVLSFAFVTTPASPPLARLHHRMPAVLNPQDRDAWLDPKNDQKAALAILDRCEKDFETHPVSKAVNRSKNDGEDLTKDITE